MIEESQKAEIVRRLKIVGDEIDELRADLNRIHEKKEAFYKEKETVSKKIAENIKGLTGSKKDRNTYTDKVRKLKEQRNELNEEIKKNIQEVKVLKLEHEKSSSKSFKEDPRILLKQVEELEKEQNQLHLY